VEEQAEDLAVGAAVSAAQGKCTKQHAQTAARNARFLSSQARMPRAIQDRFTAGNATKNINQRTGFNFLAKQEINSQENPWFSVPRK
jgi:hypothetical protein